MTIKDITVGVIGASGYTGSDLIRILLSHPKIDLKYVSANNHAGQRINEIFPYLKGNINLLLEKWEDINWADVDVIFSCLPHGIFHEVFQELPSEKIIIDLSADFRLSNAEDYAKWYNFDHKSIDAINQFTYGLTELNRSQIRESTMVACPGCYPTATLLSLYPLIKADLIDPGSIIIDAKSGVSGAGRSPKRDLLFSEISESFRPYSVTGHRHIPEIEQQIRLYSKKDIKINFIPHLVPMNRGELVTSHLKLNKQIELNDIIQIYNSIYSNDNFINIMINGNVPNTINVRGTNNCDIAVIPGRVDQTLTVISAIDNLVKGSSGQAVQNMNLIYGWPEELGLGHISIFP
ncbi:MAG: N-acetyl-gamma-glutamyl-phosphate reductase [Alphaproteobacteria bacterium]